MWLTHHRFVYPQIHRFVQHPPKPLLPFTLQAFLENLVVHLMSNTLTRLNNNYYLDVSRPEKHHVKMQPLQWFAYVCCKFKSLGFVFLQNFPSLRPHSKHPDPPTYPQIPAEICWSPIPVSCLFTSRSLWLQPILVSISLKGLNWPARALTYQNTARGDACHKILL